MCHHFNKLNTKKNLAGIAIVLTFLAHPFFTYLTPTHGVSCRWPNISDMFFRIYDTSASPS